MKKKIALFIIICISLFFIYLVTVLGKKNIGLCVDRLGLTKNSFQLKIDKNVSCKDLYIYWLGETEYTKGEEFNKILIYHQKFQSGILDSYGKNEFLIKYKSVNYKKMGILKLHPYAKHNYNVGIKLDADNLIINWSIENWYEHNIWQGNDTIRLTAESVNSVKNP